MNPERWQEIKRLYSAALELESKQREAFLEEACAGDESLRRESNLLLARQPEAEGLFASPAMELAAQELAHDRSAERSADLIGSTLLHYSVTRKIGSGGMGEVYQAYDLKLNRQVALKIIPDSFAHDTERLSRFDREAKLLASLNHPNICTIHEINQHGNRHFIVVEYVAGKTLGQKIGRKGMKFNDLLKCAIQIADALAAAHEAGIVHRDLKPANILVTESARVKVLDFGLAKLTQPMTEEVPDGTMSTALPTEEGRVMGTAAYMSPEQAQGRAVDARSDIFSFGSVLYEMATGCRAFQGDGGLSTLSAILNREPAAMSEEIPREFKKLVAHCLRKDPARRFQHMDDIRVALEDLKEEFDSGELDKTAPFRQSSRRRIAVWAFAVTLLILAAGSVFIYVQRTSRDAPFFSVETLTGYQGVQQYPCFSPDGSRVAFSWNSEKQDNFDIYIKPISSGPARKLTSDPGPDITPEWSPDGNWIAFCRAGFVYLISPEGGPERPLAQGRSFSWTPDGRFLAIARRESAAMLDRIYLVSAETGEDKGPMTWPPPILTGDRSPRVSPDGKSLSFIRYGNLGLMDDIYIQPIKDYKPTGDAWSLTNDNRSVEGFTWMPDGREIVFSSNRTERRSLWRIAVSPGATSRRVPGTDDAGWPTVSGGPPRRLVYGRAYSNWNVWGSQISSQDVVVGSPGRLVASTGVEWDPQYSPDGNRIALRSDRSGFVEIIVCRSDGSDCVPLTSFRGNRYAGSPRWLPDGRSIAFDSQGPNGVHIFIIDSQGGALRTLTDGDESNVRPSWSKDGTWIYFGSNRLGAYQIWKIPAAGGNARQITKAGGMEAFEAPDGKTLFYAKYFGTPGLWSVPVEGGPEVALPELVSVRQGNWAIAKKGLCFVDFAAAALRGPVPVRFYDFESHRVTQVGTIEKIIPADQVSFSVTRDSRRMIWTQLDRSWSNLMLIDNFR